MNKQFSNEISVLVAESFELIRLGFRSLFRDHASVRLIAETDCIEDIVGLTLQHRPNVILFDLQLNNGDCIDYIAKLLSTCPQSKVLILSNNHCEQIYLQTFRLGAAGIIDKHHTARLLFKAIYSIHAGKVWFDREIMDLLWQAQFNNHQAPKAPVHADSTELDRLKLSESERNIAYLACKGLSAKEMSTQLHISEKTIRNQLSIIYRKIGVKKQVELCLKAPHYNYFNIPCASGTNYPEIPDK